MSNLDGREHGWQMTGGEISKVVAAIVIGGLIGFLLWMAVVRS